MGIGARGGKENHILPIEIHSLDQSWKGGVDLNNDCVSMEGDREEERQDFNLLMTQLFRGWKWK